MKKTIDWLLSPPVTGSANILILRILAGGIFFWEGILKFVYPNQGVGRFTKLGFPMPDMTANFVALCEIFGGAFLMIGFLTRIVAFYFIAQMIVAVLMTKVSLFFGTSPLPPPSSQPVVGFWAVLHEIRADFALILTCLFLVLEGAGTRSVDFIRSTSQKVYRMGDK